MFYSAPDECKRRIVNLKTEGDDPHTKCATDGNNKNKNKDDTNDPNTPGDNSSLDVNDVEKNPKGTDPKDINEDTLVDTIITDDDGATLEKAPSAVKVPNDKPSADTADTY